MPERSLKLVNNPPALGQPVRSVLRSKASGLSGGRAARFLATAGIQAFGDAQP